MNKKLSFDDIRHGNEANVIYGSAGRGDAAEWEQNQAGDSYCRGIHGASWTSSARPERPAGSTGEAVNFDPWYEVQMSEDEREYNAKNSKPGHTSVPPAPALKEHFKNSINLRPPQQVHVGKGDINAEPTPPAPAAQETAEREAEKWWDENSHRFINNDDWWDMGVVLAAYAASLKESLEILGGRRDLEKIRAEQYLAKLQAEHGTVSPEAVMLAMLVQDLEAGLNARNSIEMLDQGLSRMAVVMEGYADLEKIRADIAEEKVARLQSRLTHISFVVTGNDAALIDCDPKQVDTSLKSYGETLAEAEVARLEKERDAALKDVDGWKREFNIWRSAWLREIGGTIRNKHHEIDGFVLRTRDIYELSKRAEAAEARIRELEGGKR